MLDMLMAKDTFVTHKFTINVKNWYDRIYIYPFSDVHFGVPQHASTRWKNVLKWCEAHNDNSYYMFLGDTQDSHSASERKLLSQVHDCSKEHFDEVYGKLSDDFNKSVAFMKDRTIGCIEGNHYFEFLDGTTSTMRLCQALNARYLGNKAIVRIILKKGNEKTKLEYLVYHGRGGGQTAGACFNVLEKDLASLEGVDAVISGHDHSKGHRPVSRVYTRPDMTIADKTIHLIKTGSYQTSYTQGQRSFATQRGMRAVPLGTPFITLMPYRERGKHGRGLGCDMSVTTSG